VGLQKYVVDVFLKFLKLSYDVAGIVKIALSIGTHGLKRKSDNASQKNGLSLNMSQSKECNNFGGTNQRYKFQKTWNCEPKYVPTFGFDLRNIKILEFAIVFS
jgi:hypothetical protein